MRFDCGSGGSVTVTVTCEGVLTPPAPEQTSVYVFVEESTPVLSVPERDLAPLQSPEATHESALVDVQ